MTRSSILMLSPLKQSSLAKRRTSSETKVVALLQMVSKEYGTSRFSAKSFDPRRTFLATMTGQPFLESLN